MVYDKKAYLKEYREKNKEKRHAYDKRFRQTDIGKKSRIISRWKHRGIIFDDFEWLYDLYISRHTCEHCKAEFINSSDRCLDHDHDIDDYNNVRGIICQTCNKRDVLKSK